MTELFEIPIIDAPYQRLETVLNEVSVALTLFWNGWAGRWSLSVEIDGEMVLEGRRIIVGTDLLAGYDLGLGSLYLVDWAGRGGNPGRSELPSGEFRLISAVQPIEEAA